MCQTFKTALNYAEPIDITGIIIYHPRIGQYPEFVKRAQMPHLLFKIHTKPFLGNTLERVV